MRPRRSILALVLGGVLLVPAAARSFEIGIHQEITGTVLPSIFWRPVRDSPWTLRFTDDRARELSVRVGYVDGYTFPFATNHFDDEKLMQTSMNIYRWTNVAISCLAHAGEGFKDCNPRYGQWLVEMSLHALQDFYAHSNFVTVYGEGSTLATVYGKHLGFDVLEDPEGTDVFCDFSAPWDILPTAMLPSYADGRTKLTSGYFTLSDYVVQEGVCSVSLAIAVFLRFGKCQHGFHSEPRAGLLPSQTCSDGCRGINRDAPPSGTDFSGVCAGYDGRHDGSFHRQAEHAKAKRAAETATKDYLDDLIAAIVPIDPKGVCRLFGLPEAACVVCGDGFVEKGAIAGADPEECDDGNSDNGDGCDAHCKNEFCGDGIKNDAPDDVPREECDGSDGQCPAGRSCSPTCHCTDANVIVDFADPVLEAQVYVSPDPNNTTFYGLWWTDQLVASKGIRLYNVASYPSGAPLGFTSLPVGWTPAEEFGCHFRSPCDPLFGCDCVGFGRPIIIEAPGGHHRILSLTFISNGAWPVKGYRGLLPPPGPDWGDDSRRFDPPFHGRLGHRLATDGRARGESVRCPVRARTVPLRDIHRPGLRFHNDR